MHSPPRPALKTCTNPLALTLAPNLYPLTLNPVVVSAYMANPRPALNCSDIPYCPESGPGYPSSLTGQATKHQAGCFPRLTVVAKATATLPRSPAHVNWDLQ